MLLFKDTWYSKLGNRVICPLCSLAEGNRDQLIPSPFVCHPAALRLALQQAVDLGGAATGHLGRKTLRALALDVPRRAPTHPSQESARSDRLHRQAGLRRVQCDGVPSIVDATQS